MATVTCGVQWLEDTDPFLCTNFPEPRRPLPYDFYENIALSEQIAVVHKLLAASLKLEECTFQLAPNGNYLDLELSLSEQRDDLKQFYEDIGKGKKPILILRTQLSVRVHSILEKLYNSIGPELIRSLFSLTLLFKYDKDLVPEFVNSEGLTCFIKLGTEADHNYQNYLLRAIFQIMLFVDGMNGVINHNETVQWLYALTGSLSERVVKKALQLLLLFVEYTETNGSLLNQAINTVDGKRGVKPWAYLTDILEKKNGSDSELLVYTMTLINKTLAALPDQDSFYDVTDCLEQQGMEGIMQRHMSSRGAEPDLKRQFRFYENALKYEDREMDEGTPLTHKDSRKMAATAEEGRRRRRAPAQKPPDVSPADGSESFTSLPCYEPSSLRLGMPTASISLSLVPNNRTVQPTRGGPGPVAVTSSLWAHSEPCGGLHRQGSVTEQHKTLSYKREFMMDMLYSTKSAEAHRGPGPKEGPAGGGGDEGAQGDLAGGGDVAATAPFEGPGVADRLSSLQAECPSSLLSEDGSLQAELEGPAGSMRAALAQLPEEPVSIDAEAHYRTLEKTMMTPLSKDGSQASWDQLIPSSRSLKIKDLDFSDLLEEEDIDVLDMDAFDSGMHNGGAILPPLPLIDLGSPPPPPPPPPPAVTKKMVKLFWEELKHPDSTRKSNFGCGTVWATLNKVNVDTAKLEHLFESKIKELPAVGLKLKKREIHVLDCKRSQIINIGKTALPAVHIIKDAILNFDEFANCKEGIKNILTMTPTEEEKLKIQKAQLANPDVPLGTAEHFLLTLASISALPARLQLWAFKLNYETLEKEIAKPLFDLKLGMEQLAKNKTFKCILATLLAIGNFLNRSDAKGFKLSYLEKVTGVKDTVHRQSLLHHTYNFVMENYPDTSDVYSEVPAITRSAKVDFEQLSKNLVQLEKDCKASWDSLKVMAKHETKALLKNKMSDFLKDCTDRITILKVVHRRIINRFHSFLLFLGEPSEGDTVRDTKIGQFCKIISQFSLEFRTAREWALTQAHKQAVKRERTKTRGKLITGMEKFSGAMPLQPEESTSPVSIVTGLGQVSKESQNSQDDATDYYMDAMTKFLMRNSSEPSHRKMRERLMPK